MTESELDSETILTQQSSLNFSTGKSSFCISAILKQEQLQEARERIKKEKDGGETLTSKLKSAKRVTAGLCYNSGTNRLGIDVFEVCKENHLKKMNEIKEKLKNEQHVHMQLAKEADDILTSTPDVTKLTLKKLKIVLKSLKRKTDKGSLPVKKADMIQLYENWKHRDPPVFESNDDDTGTALAIASIVDNDDIDENNNIEAV